MKFRLLLLILGVFLVLAGCQLVNDDIILNKPQAKEVANINNQNFDTLASTTEPEVVEKTKPTSSPEIKASSTDSIIFKIPESLDYPVAFATQAPYTNWDQLHEEACEEAAMTIVAKYFKQEPLNAHVMEQSILDLVKWEQANGYQVDLTAQEAAKILQDYFKLKVSVVSDVSVSRIKKELLDKNLIIIPAAGRQLGNPNFKQPGPIYHMLVIRGYDNARGEFITNDPGTRKGEGYRYKYQKLIDATHDWNHQLAEGGMTDEEIEQGQKVMIVVSK